MSNRNDFERRQRKHLRIRKKVVGTAEKPRLCVFRSNQHLYGQIIDDDKGVTMASASSLQMRISGRGMEVAQKVGEHLGKTAIEKGIQAVVFDRGGFKYHGRVKALAEAARQAGLRF